MTRRTRDDRGFTLVEVLMVVLIVGILAAVASTVFTKQKGAAADATVKSDLAVLAKAIEGADTLSGPLFRATDQASITDLGAAVPVTVSNGIRWGVSGTPHSYCLVGYHVSGRKTSTTPITYDSAAGGLGRTGKACDPADLPVLQAAVSRPDAVGLPVGRNWYVDSSFASIDPAQRTLSAVATQNVFPHHGASWQYVDVQTPDTTRAMRVVSSDSSSWSTGVVLYTQESHFNTAIATPIEAGQTYVASAWVKGPVGAWISVQPRVHNASRGTVWEWANAVRANGQWQRMQTQYVAQDAHVGRYLDINVQGNVPAGQSFLVAAPQIEKAPAATPFEVTP